MSNYSNSGSLAIKCGRMQVTHLLFVQVNSDTISVRSGTHSNGAT